ncbi:MAG: metallophosphoesterase family protein [Spirochaetales bacterium]|nr:metallophosphoesterase family protein [Spirochaetales bacterium]
MKRKILINPSLEHTYRKATPLTFTDKDKIIIISDFHMGNGKRQDDFLDNGPMVQEILEKYYNQKKWHLILNGDVEELQKFSLPRIREYWKDLYEVFTLYNRDKRLTKICGNHDDKLLLELSQHQLFPLHDGVTFTWNRQDFFVYHGHQSSRFYSRFNKLVEFALHYIAKPLGIKNYSDKDNNWKKHYLEKHSYQFSQYKKIVSIIGHTHRPLFESQSRKEMVKYKIEYLLRTYRDASPDKHEKLRKKIRKLKKELDEITKDDKFGDLAHSIYSDEVIVPCLFNSGCAIGKRGISCIELNRGKISLVYWFDRNTPQKRSKMIRKAQPLEGTNYSRAVIKSDYISYISDCLDLFLG